MPFIMIRNEQKYLKVSVLSATSIRYKAVFLIMYQSLNGLRQTRIKVLVCVMVTVPSLL